MGYCCKNFEYDNQRLSAFNKYIVANFDSGQDSPLGLNREIIVGEKTKFRNTPNHLGTKWSDNLEFEIDIIKDPKIYRGNYFRFTQEEVREIARWLTSTQYPSWLNTLTCKPINANTNNITQMDEFDIRNIMNGSYESPKSKYGDELAMTNEEVDQLFKDTVNENNEHNAYEELCFCGIFNSIEAFTSGGAIIGLRLHFTNDSPFAYTPNITNQIFLNGVKDFKIHNNSDLIDEYNYPIVKIDSDKNTDFYLCNISDCSILDSGKLVLYQNEKYIFPSNTTFPSNLTFPYENENNHYDNFQVLYEYVLKWGKESQHVLEFYYDYGAYVYPSETTYPSNHLYPFQSLYNNLQTFANGTCIQFKATDQFGYTKKCFALYLEDGRWFIFDGGFLRINIKKDVPIIIDFKSMIMEYEDGTLINFEDIAVDEVDYIYWLKLVGGVNDLFAYGENCNLTIKRTEERKVGIA